MKTLSDKINNSSPEAPRIYVEDVKQFIKDLKKDIKEAKKLLETFGVMHWDMIRIDERAGEALCEQGESQPKYASALSGSNAGNDDSSLDSRDASKKVDNNHYANCEGGEK